MTQEERDNLYIEEIKAKVKQSEAFESIAHSLETIKCILGKITVYDNPDSISGINIFLNGYVRGIDLDRLFGKN